jgi:hypothetical protein
MLVTMRAALVLLLFAGHVAADPISDLQRALPGGWRVVKTGSSARGELVIQRDRSVQVAGKYYPSSEHTSNMPSVAPAGAPTITLALRYRYETRWTDGRLAAAKSVNERVGKELEALRTRFKIDDIRSAKGTPLPETPDEEKRLAEFQVEYQRVVSKLVKLPRCALGGVSVFDDETTYGQLDLMVDPPIAMREMFAVVELVKRRCR